MNADLEFRLKKMARHFLNRGGDAMDLFDLLKTVFEMRVDVQTKIVEVEIPVLQEVRVEVVKEKIVYKERAVYAPHWGKSKYDTYIDQCIALGINESVKLVPPENHNTVDWMFKFRSTLANNRRTRHIKWHTDIVDGKLVRVTRIGTHATSDYCDRVRTIQQQTNQEIPVDQRRRTGDLQTGVSDSGSQVGD